jgi:uncharacterized membrane protein YgdD (TMEM256/DUF423 family)
MHRVKNAYIWGAFFGLTGVILGAMGAHALKDILDEKQLASWATATRFQMYHALALLILGWLRHRHGGTFLRWIGLAWVLGTFFFSGSIYLLLLTELPIALVTPLGGIVLIVGWAVLLLWAWQLKGKKDA